MATLALRPAGDEGARRSRPRADLAAIRGLRRGLPTRLLFDARAPRDATRPGGLGKAFDWPAAGAGLDRASCRSCCRAGSTPRTSPRRCASRGRRRRRCLVGRRARARRERSRQDPRLRPRDARADQAPASKVASIAHDRPASPIPSAPGPTSAATSASMAAASSPRR